MQPPETRRLLSTSLAALRWNYLGVLLRVGMQMTAQIALARILGPAAFGTVAAATLVVSFAVLVAEAGMASALVQCDACDKSDAAAAFRVVLLLSILLASMIYLGRFGLASVFGDPAVATILPALLVMLLSQSVGGISSGLLRRRLDFKSVQLATLIGYFVGFFIVGIAAALLGAGLWALVAAWISQSVVTSCLLFLRARFPLWEPCGWPRLPLRRFGIRVLSTNIANWFIENADNLFVGKTFGTSALGHYSVAYNLARNPTNHLVTSVQGVLFSSVSAMKRERAVIRRTYLLTVGVLLALTCPIFLSLAATTDTVVEALYGPQWVQASALLMPLALAMPVHALMAVGGPILWGKGEAGKELIGQTAICLIFGVLMWVASGFSLVAFAWIVLILYTLRAVVVTWLVARSIGVTGKDIEDCVRGPLVFGVLIAAALVVIDYGLIMLTISAGLRLLTVLAGGALLLSFLPLLCGRWILPSVLRTWIAAKHKQAPRLMKPWLHAVLR